MLKPPLDGFPYPRDPRSRPAAPSLPSGVYVYVQNKEGVIYVLPDGPHLHPRILGGGLPAMYAGDMTIAGGHIKDLTNLSGTFRFDDPEGLLSVADALVAQGFVVDSMSVRLFPFDGTWPIVLR